MKKSTVLVGAAISAIASVAIWLTLFSSSEEDKVKAVLGELATTVAIKEGDNVLSRTGRLRSKLKDIVEDDVRVSVPDLGVDAVGRTKLEDEAARAGLLYQSATCELRTRSIKLDAAGTVATVDATALVTGSRGSERKTDKRDVHFVLRKDSAWKISTIDVQPPEN